MASEAPGTRKRKIERMKSRNARLEALASSLEADEKVRECAQKDEELILFASILSRPRVVVVQKRLAYTILSCLALQLLLMFHAPISARHSST